MQLAGAPPSLFRAILEQIADAVICADNTGLIVFWNDAAAALFGHDADEAIGQSLDLVIPGYLQDAHWHAFRTAMQRGALAMRGKPVVTRASHSSGRRLYVEMTFALVRAEDGDLRGAVAVARDVTERIEQQKIVARRETVGEP